MAHAIFIILAILELIFSAVDVTFGDPARAQIGALTAIAMAILAIATKDKEE